MRVRNSLNWVADRDTFGDDNEKEFGPSMTVPDQTLSIADILARHARGLPLTGVRVPVDYDEDNDLPDIRTLDLAERQELAAEYSRELRALQARYDYVAKSTGIAAVAAEKAQEEPEKPVLGPGPGL